VCAKICCVCAVFGVRFLRLLERNARHAAVTGAARLAVARAAVHFRQLVGVDRLEELGAVLGAEHGDLAGIGEQVKWEREREMSEERRKYCK
jgi:hypothetical protein